MHKYLLLILDIALMLLATLAALALRENFEVSQARLMDFLPYLAITAVTAAFVCQVMGLNRAVWRFSDVPDYVRASASVTLIVASAVAITFAYNRLDGVARSLPFLQVLTGTAFLIGARFLHRLCHSARTQKKRSAPLLQAAAERSPLNILVVGVTKLAETYLQAVAELAPDHLKIAGLVGRTERHTGRLFANHPVLGCPEDIEQILDDLDVHGISVDRIVIAAALHSLSLDARQALIRVERSRPVVLQMMAEVLGLNEHHNPSGGTRRQRSEPLVLPDISFEITQAELQSLLQCSFWPLKRTADAAVALALLLIGLPLMGLVALLVASNLGFPVMFWQQRPGLGGRPFRLYKFRTLRGAHDPDGRPLADAERVSALGALLRRTRLDELPQLFNILRGDMSFIGPRPLLPRDQSDAYRTRLLVRPGLTGWAQVVGGRKISAGDKAALDVWYVRNANVILDLKIALKTVPLVVFGERISRPLIETAWRDLSQAGVLKGETAVALENRLLAPSQPL
jgi:lipopolysaccharide/colanic/teichoic acid biosynthesis glycosyltransferase